MATKIHVTKQENAQTERTVQLRSTDPGAPVQNQLWANTTDKKMKFYDGADIQSLGAAGVGSASTFALFQAEDGDISSFTNMAVESASPIAGDKSYSVSSLPAAAPAVTVDERRDGAFCVMSLISKMTSGSGRIVVKDNSSNELVSQVVSSTSAEKVSMSFSIPSGATSIQVHFEDSATPVGWIVDDIEFSDDVAAYRLETTSVNSMTLEGNGGQSIGASNPVPFAGSGTGWDGDEYTVQNADAIVEWEGSLHFTTDGQRFPLLYKNGITYKSLSVLGVSNTGVHKFGFISSKGEFAAGDVLSVRGISGTLNNTTTYHWLNINEYSYDQNIITSAQGIENEYSAKINSDGTVLSQSADFISSVTKNSTGNYTVNFVSSFFSVAPAVVATVQGGQNRNAGIDAPTTSGVNVYTVVTTSASLEDNVFFIKVQRQGSDYRNPNAYSLTPESKFQTKILSSVQSSLSDAEMTDLTFNNLVVGKTYRVELQSYLACFTGNTVTINVKDGSGTLLGVTSFDASFAAASSTRYSSVITFVAANSQVKFHGDVGASDSIQGNGTKSDTFATLIELNNAVETTDFT